MKATLLTAILEAAVRGWPLLLVLIWALAALLAYWFYRPWIRARRPFRWPLWGLRTLALGLAGALMLGFSWHRTRKVRPRPVLVVGIDHSASMRAAPDSAFYVDTFFRRIRRLLQRHRGQWRMDTLLVGQRLRRGMPDSFSDAASDLGAFLRHLREGYAQRPLHGVLFITDGIYNAGLPPTAVPFHRLPPVATVRMGDTTPRFDTRIADVEYNRRVKAGHPVPIRIFTGAPPTLAGTARLRISVDGRPRHTIRKPWQALVSAPVEVGLDPLDTGIHRITIRLDPVPGEKNTRNNVRHFLVKASNFRYRALLLMLGPHPDGAALRRRIDALDGWTVDVATLAALRDRQPPDLKDYHVLILYEWPARTSRRHAFLTERIRRFGGGIWLVAGRRTDASSVRRWWGITLRPARPRWTPVGTPAFNFPYFSTEAVTANPSAMLQQFFTGDNTDLAPLLLSGSGATVRAGTVQDRPFVLWNGQGWWQWTYRSGPNPLDALVPSLMEFLAHSRKARLTLVDPRDAYDAGRPLRWRLELTNAVGQPDPRAEVSLWIRHQDSARAEEWSAAWDGRYYQAQTRPLTPGIYHLRAVARLGRRTFTVRHAFAVTANNLEYQDLQARHGWLRTLSGTTGAPSFSPRQMADIEAYIRKIAETPLPAVSVEQKEPLMEVLALLAVILSILFAEWFLRRWAGYY